MEEKSSQKNNLLKNSLVLFICIFFFTVVIAELLHVSIAAATCMTIAQVQTDSRCLYIMQNQIYEKANRNSPHQGHPCGTDVTSIIPADHLNNTAAYLLPQYIAPVCPATSVTPMQGITVTPGTTPIPTVTPIPTMPLPTIVPGAGHTVLSTSVCLHGLGKCGDNASATSSGTPIPQHLQKQITITVLNNNNQVVLTQQGIVSFNQAAGNFTGIIDMGNLASGSYLIKEKTNGFLSAQIPGIVVITTATNNTSPTNTEVAGDTNNDNLLDISDYNAILNCYGTKQANPTCIFPPNAQTTGADINDDGVVNGADYNLFLRELSVQKGQ